MTLLVQIALTLAAIEPAQSQTRYVDLAVAPAEPPTRSFKTQLCTTLPAYDSSAILPPDYCYPFSARVEILAYKAGAGYTKASLLVRVTNSSKDKPISLPVSVNPIPVKGESRYLIFITAVEHVPLSSPHVLANAYGDTGDPTSLALIQPGESIDYEIPLDMQWLKRAAQPTHGTTVPVIVELGEARLEKADNGELISVKDKGEIPSDAFPIPCPR